METFPRRKGLNQDEKNTNTHITMPLEQPLQQHGLFHTFLENDVSWTSRNHVSPFFSVQLYSPL